MNRYFIYLAYKGTHYSGWQRQPNSIGVQQRLEEVISTILRQDTVIVGAGRTDAGVHARMMVAHFDTQETISNRIAMIGKLNAMLPKDIALYRIAPVINDAHARFSAVSRTYEYTITDKKDPFCYENECRMPLHNMDFDVMNKACETLVTYTDFTSFSKRDTDVKTYNCQIQEARWRKQDDRWIFVVKADRFLRNMVRAIVGTLFEVGRNKISIDDFRRIIEAKDRCAAGSSAPAKGLALTDITYPNHLFIPDEF